MNLLSIRIGLLCMTLLAGCAAQRISMDDPVNRALKLCGLGIDAKSADAYKAAFEYADKKASGSFGLEASNAVDTQVGLLLKQADTKTDAGRQAVADEIKATRACVIQQVEMARPLKKAELLEQCRQDVQRKISPPGNTGYGVVRNWNQANAEMVRTDVVVMDGFFDTGGSSSFYLKAKCDLRGGSFNESVIVQTGK